MSLHGSINVNTRAVGWWTARRVTNARSNTYECCVDWTGVNGTRQRHTFDLTHNYDDGAVVLAAKVLAYAAGLDD